MGTPSLPVATSVPEQPALAPDVELVGAFQGGGYSEQQWLIQRDGRFIQVSELLYRVAEQLDGKRTLDEIATTLTESTDWLVTADHVRQIVQSKLVPMGLVGVPDGQQQLTIGQPTTSPLVVNMRSRVIGPRTVEPIARRLQVFFAPLVLLPMLSVIIAAHLWLYFSHGVGGSVRDVFQTPGLILVVLAMLLASAVFHEFGHAAALRYGGGRVRGMGVGLYLIYPILYADTTDSYRLGRWARVRTGLGGVYFNLISAVAIIALYWVTGAKFLLLVVPLINLEIIRQFLPFGRLDGYWVLSDLTGIPDFLSQSKAFLQSVVPFPGRTRRPLTHLKRWVKVAFSLYLFIAIPLMAALLFFLISGVPLLAMALADAGAQQVDVTIQAQQRWDVLTMLAALAQILLVALQALAIGFMLYTLAVSSTRLLWRWSKPSLPRRAAGTLVAGGAIGLIAFLWVPQLAFLRQAALTGVQRFEVPEGNHVSYPVLYTQVPAVGGDHAPIWQNCGFYDTVIGSEAAVHSMEHGAVWITYRPDLPADQVDVLRRLAGGKSHLLVSPYPDLPTPVVVSAWGHQLALESAQDARLGQFVKAYHAGAQAPERGGPCTGGAGTPR